MLSNNPNVNYNFILQYFLETIEEHAPLKRKLIKDNQASFMKKDFNKAIYTRNRLKYKYWREQSKEK